MPAITCLRYSNRFGELILLVGHPKCHKIGYALAPEGYHIEDFTDPRAALARAEAAPFDLFLSDYRMPHMDGVTFLSRIKDLARAALYEKQKDADEVRAIESDLTALDEHIDHLDKEIEQLQQKLNDAKAKQKTLSMRGKTVESRLKVKQQINRDSITTAFARYEGLERRMDRLEGQVESMDLGQTAAGDLQSQFDALLNNDAINDELSRLKQELSANDTNKS